MCLIKFNDYFEFPRELDMEPYTVGGLAKIEGEAVDCDPSDLDGRQVRKYRYVILDVFCKNIPYFANPNLHRIESPNHFCVWPVWKMQFRIGIRLMQ